MARDEWRELELDQMRLRPDRDLVQEYGQAHPDEWGGVRFVNQPIVTIEAAFTGRLEHHRTALNAIVTEPDRLRVTQVARNDVERSRIYEEIISWIERSHLDVFSTAGKGWDRIEVNLRATGGAVAEELWSRYGDAVAITVGTKPFPPDRPPLRFDNRPRLPLPAGGPEHDGVRAEIVLDEPSVRSGETANGRIVLHNSSDRHVTIHGGQMVGCVVRPGTTEVVGVGTGPVPLIGMTVSMLPGGQGHFPLWVGTASVLPGPDPCLPAGTYEAVAVVHVTRDDVVVARAPLTLT